MLVRHLRSRCANRPDDFPEWVTLIVAQETRFRKYCTTRRCRLACSSLSELVLWAGGFLHQGHFAGPYGLRCFAGSRMHKGLSVATLFAVRGSEYRGAVCYKAIRSAEFLDVEGLPAARSFAVRES